MKNWRNSREYRIWRAKVIRRDKRCIISGDIKHREAHHIEDGSHNPTLRFDVDNGITLSRTWHTAYHCGFLKGFRCKCDKISLDRFFKLVALAKGIYKDTFSKGIKR